MSLRTRWLLAAALAFVLIAVAAWYLMSGPDTAMAVRNRLLGEDAKGVQSVLGPPTYRLLDDRQWHYTGPEILKRWVAVEDADRTLYVEFDEDGLVNRVYVAD